MVKYRDNMSDESKMLFGILEEIKSLNNKIDNLEVSLKKETVQEVKKPVEENLVKKNTVKKNTKTKK